jgi:hypothetical protein
VEVDRPLLVECPKCHKDAYDVAPVHRDGWKELTPIWYWYMRYRHYSGSRRKITVQQLKQILTEVSLERNEFNRSWESFQKSIMEKAQKVANSQTIDHMVPMGATLKGETAPSFSGMSHTKDNKSRPAAP